MKLRQDWPAILFILLLLALVLAIIFAERLAEANRRMCDVQCNSAQCACVDTCPKHRNE